jgi:DNA-binding IclR family transcriptional regulator
MTDRARAAIGDESGAVRSVRRALAILRAFRLSDRALSLGEIARRASLDKATARRLLITLMQERLVEQNAESKSYALGLGVLELGAGLQPCADLRQHAQPVLAAIAEATGATAFLGVVHDESALCIGRVDGDRTIQVRNWSIGGRLPLHCGAGPRVLMAWQPEEERLRLLARPLEALTPFTPAEPGRLDEILARIRERGWELAIDDVVEGISGLGVPVRNGGGVVVAAVSISGLHRDIRDGDRPRHLEILQSKVRDLERAIG